MMNAKTLFLASGVIPLMLLATGCTENSVQPAVSNVIEPKSEPFVTESMAKQIAETAVAERVSDDGWTKTSSVTEIYPIYISGIESPSYWECKVVTDGLPTGYVLVTANKSDVLIPELCQSGLTLTEHYRTQTGKTDIIVNRYDWFKSAAFPAESNDHSKHNAQSSPLATIGFEKASAASGLEENAGVAGFAKNAETADFEAFENNYVANAQKSKCLPGYPKDQLDAYYAELTADEPLSTGMKMADRTDAAELSNKAAAPWHTAQWNQFNKPDGSPIGCGAIAWGIVYGYWDAFKNKPLLFGAGTNALSYSGNYGTYNAAIRAGITSTSEVMGTYQGGVSPADMELGIKYAKSVGYAGSWVTRNYGTEHNKFATAAIALRNNRPCILAIHSDGIGSVDHAVVIEAARKTQTKYLFRWHDRNVYYTVNYGWGNVKKEICVRDFGANQNAVYTSTALYDIVVQ